MDAPSPHLPLWSFLANANRSRQSCEPRSVLAAQARKRVEAGERDEPPAGELPFIFHAIMDDDHELVAALAAAFDPNVREENGLTALGLASALGHPLCATPLLSFCDPNAADLQGRSPLARAARAGCVDIAAMLLPRSDPMARDRGGNLALHSAIRADRGSVAPMASLLLRAAPQTLHARNLAGATPLDLALALGHAPACRLLLAFKESESIATACAPAALESKAIERAL